MSRKGGWRGIGNLAGANQPHRAARGFGHLQDGWAALTAWRQLRRNRSFVLKPGRDGGGRRRGIGDEGGGIDAHGAHMAQHGQAVHGQAAITPGGQQLAGESVGLAHPVADEEDQAPGPKVERWKV